MTLEACYAQMGANYEDVLRRMGKEDRVRRFLLMLPGEPSYPTLQRMLEEGNGPEAFRAAHSLKGVCMNLGLTALGEAASELTEELRSGDITEAARVRFQAVREAYETALQCIQSLAGA